MKLQNPHLLAKFLGYKSQLFYLLLKVILIIYNNYLCDKHCSVISLTIESIHQAILSAIYKSY